MDQDEDYSNVVAKLQELEQHLHKLNESSGDKAQKDIHKDIETHFETCINVLLSRKKQLLAEVDDLFQQQAWAVEEEKNGVKVEIDEHSKVLESGIALYSRHPAAAVAVWQSIKSFNPTKSPSLELKISLPAGILELLEQHGSAKLERLYRSDTYSAATVSTIAGSVKGFRDGLGSHAMMNNPNGIIFVEHDKCWYFCDSSNHAIRKITLSGEITTFAVLNSECNPLAIEYHNILNCFFVTCMDNTIKKITVNGVVTHFAGKSGIDGHKDGMGSKALLNTPAGIAINQSTGDIYFADSANNVIKRLSATGIVQTFVGSRRGYKDGNGQYAQFFFPTYICFVESLQLLIVCDYANHKLRGVSLQGQVSTICDVPSPTFATTLPNGCILVCSADSHAIFKVYLDATGKTTDMDCFAGSGTSGNTDGTALKCNFSQLQGISYNASTNVCLVVDSGNHNIRKITLL